MSRALNIPIYVLLLTSPLAPVIGVAQAAPGNGFVEVRALLPSFDTMEYRVATSEGSLSHEAVILLGGGLPVSSRIEFSLSIEVGLGSLDGEIAGEGSIDAPFGSVIVEFGGDLRADNGLFQINVVVSASSESGEATVIVDASGSLNEVNLKVTVESGDSSIDSIRLTAFLSRLASELLKFIEDSLGESGWTTSLSEEWSFTGYRGELRGSGGGYLTLPEVLALVTPVYSLAAALYTVNDIYMDYPVMQINTSILISSGGFQTTLTASGETSLINPFTFTEAILDNDTVKAIIAGPHVEVEGLSYALCKLQGGVCSRDTVTVSGAATPIAFLGADKLLVEGPTSFIYPFQPTKDLKLEVAGFLVILPASSTIDALSLEPGEEALMITGSFSEVLVERRGQGRPGIAWSNGIDYEVEDDTLVLSGDGDILIEVVYDDEGDYGGGTSQPATTVTITVTRVVTETVTVTTTITETATRVDMPDVEEGEADDADTPAFGGAARVAQAQISISEPGDSRIEASVAVILAVALLIAVPLATYFILASRR